MSPVQVVVNEEHGLTYNTQSEKRYVISESL